MKIGQDGRITPSGHDTEKRGRVSALNDPDYAKKVAECFVAGATIADMAELFGVSGTTIGNWRRDPRVKAHTQKLIEDRVLAITRKIDSEIQYRLQQSNNLTIKDLISIRKEFLGGQLRQTTETIDDITVNQAKQALEDNPELAEQLEALISGVGRSE